MEEFHLFWLSRQCHDNMMISCFLSFFVQVISFGVRDYFERWYHPQISPDPICVQEAVNIINHVVSEVSDR